jgi:bifunctional non-homologous end joining protein LigD
MSIDIGKGDARTIRIYRGVEVQLSNLNKVLFPRDGYTKGDLVDYYADVADYMLPHMAGRPVTMVRYPDGLAGESWFQKEAPDPSPPWLRQIDVKKKEGQLHQVLCEKPADLVYLANLACITPHIWLSRRNDLDRPDRMILDLDPGNDDFRPVREAALSSKKMLEKRGFSPFVMTTGSRGMHVVVPLVPASGFDEVRKVAQEIAQELVHQAGDRFTLEVSKEKREGRLLIDTFRNSYGQTGVAPYAVRARDGAPVATPVHWEEVEEGFVGPQKWNIATIGGRLKAMGDPWASMDRYARPLIQKNEE